ncbi:molybdenum cofactor guanylyltransferase [Pseudomonas sp. CGJS7]|uniref:molybdenum cofactor guanylyltransferase n=1 Tax=Pseudomonas sp. CGJS7 TaxID=3109348 RepID=UPI003008898E
MSLPSATRSRMPIAASDLSLGLLAGGRASRLGGLDKAWLRRDGEAQVQRLARLYAPQVAQTWVSANRDPERYAAVGLRALGDAIPDCGPLGGLHALSEACATPWLFTVPVDAVNPDASLLPALAAAQNGQGAYVIDDDGVQPLFALWPVAPLRIALKQAFAQRRLAVRELQAELAMAGLRLDGLRLGNLNTPDDLAEAGFVAGEDL